MRIAVVAASLDILGGQSIQAQALCAGLRQAGYEVDFVPINPRFPRGLGWVRRYPYVRTVLNQSLYLPSLHRLRRADVVHVFSASYWSFLIAVAPALLVARHYRKRILLNYHSGQADDHLERWGTLVHPWLELAHEIVVPSEYLRAVFARHGYPARAVPNLVDTTRFRYRDRMPPHARFVSARNLEPIYRVNVTLEAFAMVRERLPSATLTIAGDGSERARLVRRAAALGERGITFRGRVNPVDMPALYDEADIFVNSSIVDNQPLSVLEAFAAGLPVVSTATGDIAALVRDRETGLVIPPDDAFAMAKAMTTMLEYPVRARQMARRARSEVEAFTWSRLREQWDAAYAGVPA
ncbi:MAG: glycosyl transferase family 1 [Candidatus Rokuibacteriota bacterium]|nr:MAG: glycosyl transferase family 1 [Candidatus Rokubacteria bacterium]